MSQKSSTITRAQQRRLAEMRRQEPTSDSGLPSERAPGSPSIAPTVASTSAAAVIPLTGGRIIDYSGGDRIRHQQASQQTRMSRHGSRSSRASSKGSRRSADYLRKKAEYEAELELTRLKEKLVKKKLEVDLAEIEAEEDNSSVEEADTARRVEDWIDTTPVVQSQTAEEASSVRIVHNEEVRAPPAPVVTLSSAPAASAHTPVTSVHFQLEEDRRLFATPVASVPRTMPYESATQQQSKYGVGAEQRRRDSSGERRDKKIDQLAEALACLARPRPVPRQAYELPHFKGDPAEWISYRNMYWDTAAMYNFKPHENLARLRTSLLGEAKVAVEDLLRTTTDPAEIMSALEEEYGHPNLVLQCALNKVRGLPKVSESGKELRNMATTVRNCVSLLKNIKAEGYLNNPQIVSELLNKLTPVQRAQYGDFAMGLDNAQGLDLRVSPNLQIMSNFLTHLAKATSYYIQMNTYNQIPTTSNKKLDPNKNIANVKNVPRLTLHRVHVHKDVPPTERKTFKYECPTCQGDHNLDKCNKFKDLDIDQRWELVKELKLCFKCLSKKHSKKFCRAKRCEKCDYGHHVMLHQDKSPSIVTTENVSNVGEARARALLKILPVIITDETGHSQSCYALLDDGATVSLLDSSLATNMDGPRVPLNIKTARGQGITDQESKIVSISVQGPSGQCYKVKCRTIANIDLPAQTVSAAVIQDSAHLRDLGCVEMREAKPLLLLGQDNWEMLVSKDVRRGKSGKPVASLTDLGWVIHGPLSNLSTNEWVNCVSISLPDLHEIVKAQFDLEAIGISKEFRKHRDVERANTILDNTSRRSENGSHWEVGLLWKHDNIKLPNNYSQARQRLEGIERRMRRDLEYAEAYSKQVQRLLDEGYARKVLTTNKYDNNTIWYLPHFGVVNPNKPGKLRLVFDAAAKFKGTSLNDNLLTGPDMLNSLLGVLMKFRLGSIAFTGDIADMFMRIKIREEDQGAQLFLWRDAHNRDPDLYVMNSMIFGAVSSPTTAIYILNKNAREYEDRYPEAVNAILNKHYMDDYLDSTNSVESASKLINEVTQIHASGGFNIRGWVTNSVELRNNLDLENLDKVSLDKDVNIKERTLGLIWSPNVDMLEFDLSFKRLPKEIVEGTIIPTKREFLSFIMSIFDPLGFLYPCIIQSRILMQKIWKTDIQWDEKLKDTEAELWLKWLKTLPSLKDIQIPRWYGIISDTVEMHVFGDASELAYAAVGYIVGINADDSREVAMVMGKARVTPQKVTSIPRLELQAAVLACRIGECIKTQLGIEIHKCYYWSDSKTVLKWINSDAYEFQRFVAHRLAEIDQLTERGNWRWVPSEDNPADKATRSDWPNHHADWLSGPSFLRWPEDRWPGVVDCDTVEAEAERLSKVNTVQTSETTSTVINYDRYSTWTRTVRIVARLYAFLRKCKQPKETSDIQVRDMHRAETYLLKCIQQESFSKEMSELHNGRQVSKTSSLVKLDPMLYDDGLIRVRGRLSSCEILSFDERHPVILDGRHPLARKLINHYHIEALHGNQETVINNIRSKYWITGLRSAVKKVVINCQLCKVLKSKTIYPKMDDLPPARFAYGERAFTHCGLDYFGPMEVTIGRRREKRWGVLFTCLTTRAVHLELAATLSADSALLALRRLAARRGQPLHLYSDRGTNFVGANTELRAAVKQIDDKKLRAEATSNAITWHFNPPSAPHMGGCWERLVRSVKNALKITLKERAPREEVLYTLLTEAEFVINSRPLTYVASDSGQPTIITPNHLLLGSATGKVTNAATIIGDTDARQQWRRVNALADAFWRRWLREYLPSLQQRHKWTHGAPNVKVNDVVVIVDDLRNRAQWPKGIVKSVHYGHDGIVRVVDVITASGMLRRPVAKIAVIPTDGTVIG